MRRIAPLAEPRVSVGFEPRDIWIGVFWDRKPLYSSHLVPKGYPNEGAAELYVSGFLFNVYICLVPCVPIHIRWVRDFAL